MRTKVKHEETQLSAVMAAAEENLFPDVNVFASEQCYHPADSQAVYGLFHDLVYSADAKGGASAFHFCAVFNIHPKHSHPRLNASQSWHSLKMHRENVNSTQVPPLASIYMIHG